MKRVALLVITAVSVAISPPPVLATDLCIIGNGGIVAVGKSFTLPLKNKCKPINGVQDAGLLAGTACVTADGKLLRLHFTSHFAEFDDFFSFACNIDLPAKTSGHCRWKLINDAGLIVNELFSATARSCSAAEAIVP
jgi:hypothetical protein